MLKLKSLSISFGQKKALENISLALQEKERLAVIGRNGSGKTTLALFLAGVIPDFIEATVSGNIQLPENVSLIMQNPSTQFFSMTVEEELQGCQIQGFGSEDLLHKNVFELSEGEKQKINLVSNLSTKPQLLLLDEPLELLDPTEAKRFLSAISKIRDSAIIWFDKSQEFTAGFQKYFLGKEEKAVLPEKKHSTIGETILNVSFTLQKNGFSLPNASISLRKGEKVALIGLNGSGKTSILKAIAGMEKAKGKIERKMPVSFAPQNPSHLFFKESVQEEVHLPNAKSLGIEELLLRNPSTLSKGQQKLVSVATIIPNTIALLDEPTTWLDARNKAAVYNFINDSEQPMLIATHDRKLLDYCNRILLVERNKGVHECSSTAANRFFLA